MKNKVNKILSVLIIIVMLFSMLPFTASATSSGTCGENLTWTFYNDGELIISGTGAMYDYECGDAPEGQAPWEAFRDLIKTIEICNGVTTIGEYAFYGCDNTSVTIPESIIEIKQFAFESCTSLEKVTIPDGITSIANGAFYYCISLESVICPVSVKSIGNAAFVGCKKLTVYNPNCTFSFYCTSDYTTIIGYTGSTAEAYANENGLKFELIEVCGHKNNYTERKDATCTELGYEKTICNDCGSTYSYVEIPTISHSIETIVAEPTCQKAGSIVYYCTMCKLVSSTEITDPVDHDMRWVMVTKPTSSADGVKNYSCSYCGLVEETKVVPVFLISDKSVANIDFDSNTISGFDAGAKSIDDYVTIETDGYSFTCDSAVIGTGTVIELTDGDTVITEFSAVVFGDVNGDGWYDGTDSIIVSCLANGLLSKDDVSPAFYTAADCNHDGVIDSFDVAILEQAGLLLSNVDQSKSNEELATDEAFIEYLDLIDQTPDDETVEDEVIETPKDEPETPETKEFDLIEFIITIIKKFFELLLSSLLI